MKVLIFACLAFMAFAEGGRSRRSASGEYRMCVPEILMPYCEQMIKEETKSAANIICVPARDRIECIDKVKAGLADFGTMDPEDMYVASKVPDNEFTIFEEIRTREEPEAEYRYEGIALVHKDLDIKSAKDLKGLTSCHTGVGRNVGYKIPLTKLKNMGVIGNLADPAMSPRENELHAFSNLFSKSCIVGQWSPDPEINKKLKKKYSNLCAMCEHPDKCDYPDNFSGYDGAIRCLVHNNGQIAFTKVIYVRKFFGLPVGVTPGHETNERAENYAYFCPDGSKVPITSDKVCTWAARPWQGYMTNGALVKSIDELRKKLQDLNNVGYKSHAEWLQKVLEVSDKNVIKDNKPISPKDYLDKSNYTDVIEREYGPPFKNIRICAIGDNEMDKCKKFAMAAFTRNVRPRFTCVQENCGKSCAKAIQNNAADTYRLPAFKIPAAMKNSNLKPILRETYKDQNYAVVVVKKSSNYNSLADLKGAKSCHSSESMPGYYAPIHALKKQGLISKTEECNPAQSLAEYFSEGCFPYAEKRKVSDATTEKICSLCPKSADKCRGDGIVHEYAYDCLKNGGDVAFVQSLSLQEIPNAESGDYELICPSGKRAPLTDYKTCNLLEIPPDMIVTANSKTDDDMDEIRNALLDAAQDYSKRPDWFRLFGKYDGKHNLLFSDYATGFESLKEDSPVVEQVAKIVSVVDDFCK